MSVPPNISHVTFYIGVFRIIFIGCEKNKNNIGVNAKREA